MGRRLGPITLALTALAIVAGPLAPAGAHAELDRSVPADGANLAQAPGQLELYLSESVEVSATRVTVTNGQGQQVPVGAPQIVGAAQESGDSQASAGDGGAAGGDSGGEDTEEPVTLTVTLPALPPDLYHVSWETLSSDDLHETSGDLVFGVQRAVVPRAARPSEPAPPPLESATRWLALLGIALAAGSLVLLALLRAASADTPDGAAPAWRRRLLRVGATGAAGAGLATLGLLAVQVGASADPTRALRALLLGGYGARWLAGQAAVVALAVLLLRAVPRGSATPRDGRRLLGAGLLLVAARALVEALTGHAGAEATSAPVRLVLTAAHVLAALVWVGTVLAAGLTWRVPDGALRMAVLRRFGPVAAGCLAVMTVTGIALAGEVVASLDALIGSVYGRVLLAKLALVALALLAAGQVAAAIRPDLVPRGLRPVLRPIQARLPLRILLGAEATAAVTVLLAAATLAAGRPAIGPLWAAPTPVRAEASGVAGDLVEQVSMSPNQPGRNFVAVSVFDSRRPAPAPITGVRVTLTGPDGRIVSSPAVPQGGDAWLLTTDAVTAPGAWRVGIDVTRPGLPVTSAVYDLGVADPSGPARRPVAPTAALQPWTTWTATGLAGLLLALAGLGVYRGRTGARIAQRTRGNRRVISAPPRADAPADAPPPALAATAATSARPNPLPGSRPGA